MKMYLWRDVDAEGEVLDFLVQANLISANSIQELRAAAFAKWPEACGDSTLGILSGKITERLVMSYARHMHQSSSSGRPSRQDDAGC